MRVGYGPIEVSKESALLQIDIAETVTTTGTIERKASTLDSYGSPSGGWAAVYTDIAMAVNHHSEQPGNIVGPALLTANRFVATLPTRPDIQTGDRILFDGIYYHVDTVSRPVSIEIATEAFLTQIQ